MSDLVSRLQVLTDPEPVWKFQQYFGVKKVKVVKTCEDDPWVALDVSDIPRERLPENVKVSGAAPELDETSFQEEHKYNLRIRATLRAGGGVDDECSSAYSSDDGSEQEDANIIYYKICSQFWHLFFRTGTELGDETFYAIFFTFWFWNIDGAVGRRVILVWNLTMYIGQGLKDIIRWNRPSMPPVVQLERKWALEYGMPSTHAMVGLAVPFSIVTFIIDRYELPSHLTYLFISLVFVWCAMVCTSRIYLGMHSLADIAAGLAMDVLLLPFILPLVHHADFFLLSSRWAPVITISLSLMAVWFYPGSDRWTPARGDTTIILGAYLGTQLGNWLNYRVGFFEGIPMQEAYPIIWPDWSVLGLTLLRLAIGAIIVVSTKAVFKPLSYLTACYLLKTDKATIQRQEHSVNNRKKLAVELFYKFVTYVGVGFTTCFIAPFAFRFLGCERPSFYTEL